MTEMFLILTKTLDNLSDFCGYPDYVEVANYQDPSHNSSLLYTAVPCLPTQSGPTVESAALLQQGTSRTAPGREQHSALSESCYNLDNRQICVASCVGPVQRFFYSLREVLKRLCHIHADCEADTHLA